MQIFYVESAAQDKQVHMDGQEWRHCHKSLRHDKGDEIIVVDGKGGSFKALITAASKDKGSLKVLKPIDLGNKRRHYIHIALGPTKQQSRMEWAIEKMMEIGVDEMSFIQSRYSERSRLKSDRIEKICISAMKQSLQSKLPDIHPMQSLRVFLESLGPTKMRRFIAYVPEDGKQLAANYYQGEDVIIIIGPEGGFTSEEIDLAKEYDFIPVSLGANRLRTETACIVACTILNS